MPPRKQKPVEVTAPAVAYPQVCVTVCGSPEQTGMPPEKLSLLQEALRSIGLDSLIAYAPPLTAVDMMTLLGWQTETSDGEQFGEDYLVKDFLGNKVRCSKNVRNRPVYPTNIETIVQDVLNLRWELNGETIIVSDTANVLDGQHTGIAVVIAQQRLENERDAETGELIWKKNFPGGVVAIPKIVVYGVKGTDRVVNTMNTCRPRSFADVLYRSSYFAKLPARSHTGVDRQGAAVLTAAAVKQVWHRTGIYMSNYAARQTNSESIAWLEAHGGAESKFIACVRHILEQNQDGRISRYVPLGYAVCAMWLMACGDSDEEKYYAADERTVALLKWKYFKQAAKFWSDFGLREESKVVDGKDGKHTVEGNPTGDLKGLTEVLDEMTSEKAKEQGVGMRELDYVIAGAWQRVLAGGLIQARYVRLSESNYSKPAKGTGVRTLVNTPRYGNLDLGINKLSFEKKVVVEADAAPGSSEEEARVDAEVKTLSQSRKESEDKANQPPVEPELPEGTSKKLAGVKVSAQSTLERLQLQNPEVEVILLKNKTGRFEVWGEHSKFVGDIAGKTPSVHPNESLYLKFNADEIDEVIDKVNAAGYTVALADHKDGEPVLTSVCKPKPQKR